MTTPPSDHYGVPQPGPSARGHRPSTDRTPIGGPPGGGPGVPPPRYGTPGSAPSGPSPKRRDPGQDPSERRRSRPWLVWALTGTVLVVVLALVVGVLVSSGGSDAPVAEVAPTSTAGDPSIPPTSTLATADPTVPSPGAVVPISVDVSFPEGMTIVRPVAGDWMQSTQDRQPEAVVLEDTKSDAYLSVLALPQLPSTYRDEDLTRASLNGADAMFTGGKLSGEPMPFNISGSGYTLEFLAQRVTFEHSSNQQALVISRIMPSAGIRIQIIVIARTSDLNDPESRIMQKLREVSFSVP
ncbi:hypothetical protein F8O01_09970 [Pseudoclavibacter chungangensis]|uniref:Uncharacterized protein n=1 Tax=Pseudoclavibacter chungangensis TaxID=587635 RepID=A0A7J5BR10_9MICO|nr:hypothetical protein [Pseudoclavibacter chungangensis]KAB1656705.1 hypothetical protein F8O01_09970 [Pseudoclavibacter chungangensis]NYJ67841.1 hypothetical protein [Pseudoclavibacter chungangensis]